MRASRCSGVWMVAWSLTAVVGGVAARPMTAEDVARLSYVADAAVSPDGQRVAFAVALPRSPHAAEDGPPRYELRVGSAIAEDSRTWVRCDSAVSQVRFAPDGRRISFLAKRADDDGVSLWAIPSDGGEAVRLVGSSTGISQYVWRPDGGEVFYIDAEPVPAAEEARRKRGYDQQVFHEQWQSRRLMRASIPAEVATEGGAPSSIDGLPGQPFALALSPDGQRIAVSLAPTSRVDDEYMAQVIHVVDAQTGRVIGKVEHQGKLGDFAFSHAKGTLAFVAGADIHDPTPARLWSVDAGGGPPRRELIGREADEDSIEALPGGGFLLLTHAGVHSRLERWAPGKETTVAFAEDSLDIAKVSVNATGKRAVIVASSRRTPWTAWSVDLGRKAAPVRLFDPNPWLAEVDFGQREVLRWDARDGLAIEGVLIRPVGASTGPAPLLVVVHGGPESHVANGWLTGYTYPGEVAAGAGYAVFYPNYRGGTGRGHAFAVTAQGDGGGREFDDILDGIDALVAKGIADGSRVGITGGSYGGYLTAWAATRHTDRFGAAVMAFGISNLVSKLGTTEIPNESRLVHWLTTAYDAPELFRERSPITYAAQARTPLLILHGARDQRVDVGQSKELYRALSHYGVAPTRLIVYPRDGHGNHNAASRFDYNLRMMEWFEHFLRKKATSLPPAELDGEAPESQEKPK